MPFTQIFLHSRDREFQYWNHMQMLIYGEAHFHQFQLGLIPESHWRGLANFLANYVASAGFDEFWQGEADSFSDDYKAWISAQVQSKKSQS